MKMLLKLIIEPERKDLLTATNLKYLIVDTLESRKIAEILEEGISLHNKEIELTVILENSITIVKEISSVLLSLGVPSGNVSMKLLD